jgi:Fe-Mn family superoxide dismutase
MSPTTRRQFMHATAAGSLLVASSTGGAAYAADAAGTAAAATGAVAGNTAYLYQHKPVPLPYAAGALPGLSEKLMQSHWENNYSGAVAALNTVRGRLAQALADAGTPAYVYNGLKREQLLRTGSVVLHELYFAGLGGDGKAGAGLRSRIAASFGTFDLWESEFRKIGAGLGGGSGWVMLGYNRRLQLLENCWMADHATAPADTVPVLVMDMYEHAYQMDFGAAAARYIDAFFRNINWDVAARRLA